MLWSYRIGILLHIEPLQVPRVLVVRRLNPLPVNIVADKSARGAVATAPAPLEVLLTVTVYGYFYRLLLLQAVPSLALRHGFRMVP